MSEQYSQQHFVLYEIVLPYCTVCTPADGVNQPFYTPVTCVESSDSQYSLWFAMNTAPNLITQPTPSISGKSVLNSKIFKCVYDASESTSRLKAGEGFGSRGTMKISCSDFNGDPGPIEFTTGGTFFGKLVARNVLQNKIIKSHYYTIAKDPTTKENKIELQETHTHFIDDFQLSDGKFTISGKDALKDTEAFGEKFPAVSSIELTADIDSSQVVIPVNDASTLATGEVVRIEEEAMLIQSIASNNVTVATRGTTLTSGGEVVYKTNVSEHSSGSTVQKCYVMANKFLTDVFSDIYTAIGLGAYIDYQQWQDEISTWSAQSYLFGLYGEPTEASEIIDRLCKEYMIDMWLDQATQKIKVSASTAWKQSIRVLEEGNDIQGLKIKQSDAKRFSRAFLYNKKEFKLENDDVINYGKVTAATDLQSETSDFYGKVKEKDMGKSSTITVGSAQTTVSRFVQRFSRPPKTLTFSMEERKLGQTSLSDIVDVISRGGQTPSGEYLQARDRAQIIEIKPDLKSVGRKYTVTALSYVPLISTDGGNLVITLSGSLIDVNLYSRAGAPAEAVNVTYIFDGCTIGSSQGVAAVRAGLWPTGSVITIICINGTKWSAKGGDGGSCIDSDATVGVNGADSYQSDGIETKIYLNYGVVSGFVTDCTLFAAGGGGGAAGSYQRSLTFPGDLQNTIAVSGSGGSGIPGGKAGIASAPADFQNTDNRRINDSKPGQDGSFDSFGISQNISWSYTWKARTHTGNNIAGSGGLSLNGSNGQSSGTMTGTGQTTNEIYNGMAGGLAGGAFRGNNITVYNLTAESSKLKDGNSDAYTLITA